ncbi:MAG TPA: STN domain-containing protein [Pirellulales bacterium]|jgi:hypothetical protein|nr:STN domain-containing protein [Pirellulales bacterium]
MNNSRRNSKIRRFFLADAVAQAIFPAMSLAAAMALMVPASIQAAPADEPITWLTGDKLRAQMDQQVGATWEGDPFRRALTSLARSQHVAILLDRRVDPDQKIEISFDDLRLEAAIKLIASKKQIGMALVGSVIFLGPTATTEKIRTLAALRKAEALRLPAAARSRFLQLRPMHWDELAAPRDLVSALAAESHIEIQAADRIPHDLWASADLAAGNFIDRLTLIAGQFDLTFSIAKDGQSVRLVDITESVEIERSYPLRGGLSQRGKEIATKLAELLPGAKIELAADKLTVRGRAEDLDFTESYLSGRTTKQTTVTNGQKTYSLTVVKPVGALIKAIGEKMDLDVRIDEEAIKAAGLSLTAEVKVNVNNATADELLKAVLAPVGLTYERHGNTIDVRPEKK